MTCVFEGVVTRAERVYEGVEDDHYACVDGHAFGVDWSRGAPGSPQWPPLPEEVAAIEASRPSSPPGPMVADTERRRFVAGAATRPAEALLAWLAARREEGGRRRLRLPVVLARGQVGFSLRGARVGGGADALEIRCDDGALGVGLADRARRSGGDAPSCALWLEGFWRGGDDRVFAVVKVGEAIAPEALGDAMAEIQVFER
jgi:hypothetical protein